MKKIRATIVTLVIFVLIFAIYLTIPAYNSSNQFSQLVVQPKTENILLGELANFNLTFYNTGNSTIEVPVAGLQTGLVKIFISNNGIEYRRYVTAGFGKSEVIGARKTLRPNESFNTDFTILWNGKPDYSNLNPQAAKDADNRNKRINTDLAFPLPGVYYVKALMPIMIEGSSSPTIIESQPAKIIVNEPNGQDLRVWNQIKSNPGEFAFLIQHGSFSDKVGKNEDINILIGKIQQIIIENPNSSYSKLLKQGLDKFISKKEKERKRFERMIRQPNRPM